MIQFEDRAPLTGSRITSDGYMVAEVRCARTGIQQYLASEIGMTGDGIVNVYRPEEAVFDKASLGTFAGKPVTIGHPAEGVTADNWKALAVGDVGEDIARDGEFVRVPMRLMDAAAIRTVQGGTREISMGYTCGLQIGDGVTPDGKHYDAMQTGPIRINHLAIVPKARGGSELRIGDAKNWGASPVTTADMKGSEMTDIKLRTVVVGDEAVNTTDEGARAIEKLKAEVAARDAKIADTEKAHAAALAAKDEEIGGLKASLKTAQDAAKIDVDKLVSDRAALVASVRAVDATIDPAGKSDADLRKAAVAAKLGDDMVKDASEAEITGMFKAIAKDAKPADPVRGALKDGAAPAYGTEAGYAKAVSDSRDRLNAWRTAGKEN